MLIRKRPIHFIVMALIACLSASYVVSCKKYPEGPAISFRSKKARIVNDWKIKRYERNGVEETGLLQFKGYIERFFDDGTYSREYTTLTGTKVMEEGTWELSGGKDSILVKGIAPIELTNETGTVDNSNRKIWMLKNDEMKYRYDEGQYTHEMHVIPNE